MLGFRALPEHKVSSLNLLNLFPQHALVHRKLNMFTFWQCLLAKYCVARRSGSDGYPPSLRLVFRQNAHPKTQTNLIYSVLRSCLNLILRFSYGSFSAHFPLFFAPYRQYEAQKELKVGEKIPHNKFQKPNPNSFLGQSPRGNLK